MRKYKGPARGIPTHREIISDKAEAVFFIVMAIVATVILYLE